MSDTDYSLGTGDSYDLLEGYGVILKRLTEDKIELVRSWRNDPKVSQFMEYRKYITSEEQLKWFHRINNSNNFYYLIVVDNTEIGLINIRDINYSEGFGEPGIFIWDDRFLNSDISFRSAFVLTDFAFNDLKLSKMIVHVLSDNIRAIKYNKAYGYRLSPNQEKQYSQEYTLEKDRYLKCKDKIIKYL